MVRPTLPLPTEQPAGMLQECVQRGPQRGPFPLRNNPISPVNREDGLRGTAVLVFHEHDLRVGEARLEALELADALLGPGPDGFRDGAAACRDLYGDVAHVDTRW